MDERLSIPNIRNKMIAGKVSASSASVLLVGILWLLRTENYVSTTRIECMPLKICPLAMKLIRTKPYAPETIAFLQYSHCGLDGHDVKVWCPLFLHCKTPDSRNGTCKNIKECDSFMGYMENVNHRDPVVKKYLREYRCSTEHDPEIRVCCPDEGKMTHVFTTKDVHERFSTFFPDPELGECGRQNSDNRIVGGTETYLDEYPWLALLKYINRKKVQHACAGSLINDQYVVTAAHCVDQNIIKQKNLGKLQSVILGEYDTRNKTDCIYEKFGDECADPPQEFSVADFIMHPDYNSKFMINDIAIIKLDRKAILSDFVQPLCLPSINFYLQGNESFTISGWGRTETAKRSPVKRKATLGYTEKSKCNQYNGVRNLTEGQMCAGNGNGVDSCYGDSGGPLMLNVKTRSGYFATFAVGMVSYGYGPLCGSFPGVYTFLPFYVEWIHKEIQ